MQYNAYTHISLHGLFLITTDVTVHPALAVVDVDAVCESLASTRPTAFKHPIPLKEMVGILPRGERLASWFLVVAQFFSCLLLNLLLKAVYIFEPNSVASALKLCLSK